MYQAVLKRAFLTHIRFSLAGNGERQVEISVFDPQRPGSGLHLVKLVHYAQVVDNISLIDLGGFELSTADKNHEVDWLVITVGHADAPFVEKPLRELTRRLNAYPQPFALVLFHPQVSWALKGWGCPRRPRFPRSHPASAQSQMFAEYVGTVAASHGESALADRFDVPLLDDSAFSPQSLRPPVNNYSDWVKSFIKK